MRAQNLSDVGGILAPRQVTYLYIQHHHVMDFMKYDGTLYCQEWLNTRGEINCFPPPPPNNQLYWIDLLKKNRNRTAPCRPQTQPVRILLPFKTIYIYYQYCGFVVAQALCDKTSTIGIYDFYGKGLPTACSLHGYSLVSVLL